MNICLKKTWQSQTLLISSISSMTSGSSSMPGKKETGMSDEYGPWSSYAILIYATVSLNSICYMQNWKMASGYSPSQVFNGPTQIMFKGLLIRYRQHWPLGYTGLQLDHVSLVTGIQLQKFIHFSANYIIYFCNLYFINLSALLLQDMMSKVLLKSE